MFLRVSDNLRYKKINTELKNIYITGIYGYPQDLLVVMKLLNNYITENGRNNCFRKRYRKDQMGVSFTQIQGKDMKNKKKKNTKGKSHFFHCVKQGHWVKECTEL